MFKKELIRDVDLTSMNVTTHKTRVDDIFEPGDIILAVNRNDKDRCGLVHYRYEYDGHESKWIKQLSIMSPTFAENARKLNVFDTLWELQGFYDVFVFDDFASLQEYMQDNKLEWEK